jgi:DNA-binding NarL/FixJ family response regulator
MARQSELEVYHNDFGPAVEMDCQQESTMPIYHNTRHSPIAVGLELRESEGAIPLNLSIFSNSSLLREGILNLLAAYIEFNVVGCYTGNTRISSQLPNPPNHVLLLDAQIGFETAIQRIQECQTLFTPPRIVILEVAEDDIDRLIAYIEAGANGYIIQGASAANVAMTIEGVQHGLVSCSPRVTAHLFARLASRRQSEEIAPTPMPTKSPLTAREIEVLTLIGNNYSNKQIGETLQIEVCTVKYHIHNILDKLQLRYRWDAARYAQSQGWLIRAKA